MSPEFLAGKPGTWNLGTGVTMWAGHRCPGWKTWLQTRNVGTAVPMEWSLLSWEEQPGMNLESGTWVQM